jgi:hypothetical protein
MAKSKTRKQNKQQIKGLQKVLTIPMLRKAFEHIDMESRRIIRKHPINEESILEFQKLWKTTFGKSIDKKTAESYLVLQSKMKVNKKKTRKMKGGSAPVDYMLRPGLDGTHGSYLPYVSKGLDFYGDINNIAMDSDCGKVNISPQITSSMGSNQVGAGLGEFMYSLTTRPIQSTTPPSVLQDLQDTTLGRELGASPKPIETHYKPV